MGADGTPEIMAEIDRQMLSAMTGWPLEVIDRMSRADRRRTLIFRDELEVHRARKR